MRHLPLFAILFLLLALAALSAGVVLAREPQVLDPPAPSSAPAPAGHSSPAAVAPGPPPAEPGDYVVLAWNDLGMHCYNRNFQDIGVLPPYNNLYAQVLIVGDPPQVVTAGVTVTYQFTDNTTSVTKSNFWDYDQALFGVDLPPDVGLTGKGLAGDMDVAGDHFVAEGIPLTEFRDSDPNTPYPYQVATIIVYDQATGQELARTTPVAPVSTEMHCDNCHYDNGPGNEGIATGVIEQNILTKHDDENMGDYPPGHPGPLMDRRPILCAECHASNALGAPGVPELPNLSNAVHDKHKEIVPDTTDGCYNCHPGPQTRCLRDVMSARGMDCVDCHGGMAQVANNPDPWLNEPRCDSAACHGSGFQQDQPLYRQSKEHGGVFCEACHDSTHAVAPSTQANDALKFVGWQGHNGPLDVCTVCHATFPAGPGPHGLLPPTQPGFTFGPDRTSMRSPGEQAVYLHGLHNSGNVADTYHLTFSSSQGWATVAGAVAGGPTFTLPADVALEPDGSAVITVTVTIPGDDGVRGLTDTTVITASSTVSPTLVRTATDVTIVLRASVYLPLIAK
jgi:hypothetical protein